MHGYVCICLYAFGVLVLFDKSFGSPGFPFIVYYSYSSIGCSGLQPTSDGLHPSSDGLHPSSDGLQPKLLVTKCYKLLVIQKAHAQTTN